MLFLHVVIGVMPNYHQFHQFCLHIIPGLRTSLFNSAASKAPQIATQDPGVISALEKLIPSP